MARCGWIVWILPGAGAGGLMSVVSSGQLAWDSGHGRIGEEGDDLRNLVPVATVQFRADKLIVTLSACIMHHVLLS